MATNCEDVTAAVTAAVTAFFRRERPVCPNNSGMYKLSDAYGTNPYWANSVRSERFNGTLPGGFLYRPAIVDDLYLRGHYRYEYSNHYAFVRIANHFGCEVQSWILFTSVNISPY